MDKVCEVQEDRYSKLGGKTPEKGALRMAWKDGQCFDK